MEELKSINKGMLFMTNASLFTLHFKQMFVTAPFFSSLIYFPKVNKLNWKKHRLQFTVARMEQGSKEQGWHSRLVRDLGARGPEFDSRISHPCFDFFPFRVAK